MVKKNKSKPSVELLPILIVIIIFVVIGYYLLFIYIPPGYGPPSAVSEAYGFGPFYVLQFCSITSSQGLQLSLGNQLNVSLTIKDIQVIDAINMNATSINTIHYTDGIVIGAGRLQKINLNANRNGSSEIRCLSSAAYKANVVITYTENLSSGPKTFIVNGTITGLGGEQ